MSSMPIAGGPERPQERRLVTENHSPASRELLTCGTWGNALRFLPPLCMPDHLLLEEADVLERVLEEN